MADDRTEVIILTRDFRIQGDIDLLPGARLTDYVNEAKRFIAVTNVTVANHSGQQMIFKAAFINVLVQSIEVILPAASEAERLES